MPLVKIYVSQSDIEAAHRIARRMFPEQPDMLDARHVISSAANVAMRQFRVQWHDAEDQANLYANAMVKRDKLARDTGREDHDRTTDGMPMKEGQ